MYYHAIIRREKQKKRRERKIFRFQCIFFFETKKLGGQI